MWHLDSAIYPSQQNGRSNNSVIRTSAPMCFMRTLIRTAEGEGRIASLPFRHFGTSLEKVVFIRGQRGFDVIGSGNERF